MTDEHNTPGDEPRDTAHDVPPQHPHINPEILSALLSGGDLPHILFNLIQDLGIQGSIGPGFHVGPDSRSFFDEESYRKAHLHPCNLGDRCTGWFTNEAFPNVELHVSDVFCEGDQSKINWVDDVDVVGAKDPVEYAEVIASVRASMHA